MAKKKVGRKSKLTDEIIEDIKKAVAMGLNNKAVCDYVGLSEPTFYDYYAKGEEDFNNNVESQFSKFFKSYKKARADFRIYHLAKIRQASESGSWQASAWCLERCMPDEFNLNRIKSQDEDDRIEIINDVPNMKGDK